MTGKGRTDDFRRLLTKAEIVEILGGGFDDEGNYPACIEDFRNVAHRAVAKQNAALTRKVEELEKDVRNTYRNGYKAGLEASKAEKEKLESRFKKLLDTKGKLYDKGFDDGVKSNKKWEKLERKSIADAVEKLVLATDNGHFIKSGAEIKKEVLALLSFRNSGDEGKHFRKESGG